MTTTKPLTLKSLGVFKFGTSNLAKVIWKELNGAFFDKTEQHLTQDVAFRELVQIAVTGSYHQTAAALAADAESHLLSDQSFLVFPKTLANPSALFTRLIDQAPTTKQIDLPCTLKSKIFKSNLL